MSKTGLFQLPGSLTATMPTISDMPETLKYETINFAKKETDRVAGADQGLANADFYIMAEYDINDKITYTGSSATNSKDDGYSLTGFTITSANASSPVLLLPTGSESIKAGTVTAKDTVNTSNANGTFDVNMAISITNQGVFDAVTVSITGSTLSKTIADDPNKAQVAYWDTSTPADPSATAADTLSATLSSSDLDTHFATERAAIKALYTGDNANQISSWSMSISAVANSNENVLAKHATFKSRSGSDVFEEGEMIVAATPLSYSIKIKDVDDVDKTIVQATNVYGIVKQN